MIIRNKITGDTMPIDDSLGINLIKKHPFDFELVEASENVKKAVEIAKVPTDEAKLLGIDKEPVSDFDNMTYPELKAYVKEHNIEAASNKKEDLLKAIKGLE